MEWDLPPQDDAPERVSHRYHLIRVIVTLSVIGVVAVVSGLAVLYLNKGGGSTTSVEAAMLAGR